MSIDIALRELVREVVREEIRAALRELPATPRAAQAEEFLSVLDAAAILGVHPSTLRGWISSGRVKSFKAGRHHRLRRDDLQAFMDGVPDAGPVDVEALARRLAAV
jgi:excisionase family DNA binding protein